MMFAATQIRRGMIILYENEPHKVISFRFTVSGRGSNTISAKLYNIVTRSYIDVKYRSDDKVERVSVSEVDHEFLYQDGEEYWFMNSKTFEQIPLQKADVEDIIGYILPNTACRVQLFEGRPIGVKAPNTVQLKVEETEPSIKGATATGNVGKPAKLETGITIQVPMFVQRGDTVIINTETGEYQGRPGK